MNKNLWITLVAAVLMIGAIGCAKKEESTGTTGGTTAGGTTGGSTGSTAQNEGPVTLRLAMNKGDKYEVAMEMDSQVDMSAVTPPPGADAKTLEMIKQGGSMKMSTTEEREVVDVQPGKITVKGTTTTATGDGTGIFQEQAKAMAADEKGKEKVTVNDERNRRVDDPAAKGDDSLTFEFPEKEIKVGDTWTGKTKFQDKDVEMTFKFEKRETVDGIDTAVVSATFEGPEFKTVEPMMSWYDIKTGVPIKGTGKIEMSIPNGGKVMMTMNMTVKKK
ncbi:MAG TPA: hypothetical protein PLH94_10860 [Fimbriimonadaceae bacterium]|nr:hypothetical protein [Fimbriimonadaceae bacterium]